MNKLFVALCLALVSGVANAQGQWISYGYGNDSCGKFLKAIDAMAPSTSEQTTILQYQNKVWFEPGLGYEQWLVGFVTGFNFSQPTPAHQVQVDKDGIVQWVHHYCETHGDESLVLAASRFLVHERDQQRKGSRNLAPNH